MKTPSKQTVTRRHVEQPTRVSVPCAALGGLCFVLMVVVGLLSGCGLAVLCVAL